MTSRSNYRSGSRGLMVCTLLVVTAGTLVAFAIHPFAASKRAQQARNMNNIRLVKLTLDALATDFGGQFPNKDIGKLLVAKGTGTKFSNDFFRQLFLTGETDSEELFWVKGAAVCTAKKPDDVIGKDGKPFPSEILKAGDCGWAYMKDQTNTSHLGRPLLVSAYGPASKGFEKKLFGGKLIIARIDGSVVAATIDAEGKASFRGEDPLSSTAKPWQGSDQDPAKLLVQPLPKAKAKAK
jgi:hypothetical protein